MKPHTNRILLLFMALVAISLQSCLKDKCEGEYTYFTYEPVYISYEQLRSSIASESPRALESPGKIWFSNNYIFINERDKGIHVINNANPGSPVNEAFINIPGNIDLAVRGNTLYADSYIDLVALDISNPTAATVTKRIENALPQRGSNGFGIATWDFQQTNPNGVITHYNQVRHAEPYEVDCNGNLVSNDGVFFEGDVLTNMPANDGITPVFDASSGAPVNNMESRGGDVGSKGGSMARFALGPNFLYIVDNSTMHLYNIASAANPTFSSQVQVGWDIETIFMYRQYLFLGSMTGMHIYDNSNPANPVWVSTYSHVSSCDPVVVEGNYAYVTLRSGTPCDGFTNQLDVVDISDIANPTLAATYPMTNPHGLGIEAGTLFLCDGADGLKVLDASNPLAVTQTQHFPGVHAYDVIPFQKRLFMIGDNGFYQYDYSNPNNLVLLSTIAVQ